MGILDRTSRRILVLLLFVTVQVSGCTTLDGLKKSRDFPKVAEPITYDPKRQDFWYDKSVRAYRHMPKDKENGHPRLEPVVRDGLGKKVQCEEELITLSDAQPWKVQGTSTKVATTAGTIVALGGIIVETIIFLPCTIVFHLVQDVLVLPFLPIASHLEATYSEAAERAYAKGRDEFAGGSFDSALASWDHAEQLMPSLQAFSDIDFWRGQTFDALNQPRAAALAYATFLSYSESSIPSYFKSHHPDEPTWEWKANQAETKIVSLSAQAIRATSSITSQSVKP